MCQQKAKEEQSSFLSLPKGGLLLLPRGIHSFLLQNQSQCSLHGKPGTASTKALCIQQFCMSVKRPDAQDSIGDEELAWGREAPTMFAE